jgi:hypothetical protein
MSGLEHRLAAIGYRVERRSADCWRVERVGPPSDSLADRRAVSARRRSLSLWLDRLRDRDRQQAIRYRICLASEIK